MAKIDRAAKVQLLADFDAQYAAFVTAGMDEAGRGPLVGNVVAACVVMPKEPLILWVDDSKKLSEKRRESVYAEIMERALYVGIGQATAELARAFGMNVIYYSRHGSGEGYVPLDELYARSDIVSLHCPQTPENVGMIDKTALAKSEAKRS